MEKKTWHIGIFEESFATAPVQRERSIDLSEDHSEAWATAECINWGPEIV